MNRFDLRQMAEDRVLDAECLLNSGRWSGAYYLAGYAVECGLKACIAKLTRQDDFPSKEFVLRCYTHRIDELLHAAGLRDELRSQIQSNRNLSIHWMAVLDWSESARYESWPETKARKLVTAVADSTDGVLKWVRGHW